MNIKHISRQNGKWVNQCHVYVEDISAPQETKHGLCQVITAVFDQNVTETINYFFNDTQFAVDVSETGRQWYDIRKKDNYYQCKPCDPKQIEERTEDVDWDKVNLGKCRHGILCAWVQSGKFFEVQRDGWETKDKLEAINKLAKFSMTGEFDD